MQGEARWNVGEVRDRGGEVNAKQAWWSAKEYGGGEVECRGR